MVRTVMSLLAVGWVLSGGTRVSGDTVFNPRFTTTAS